MNENKTTPKELEKLISYIDDSHIGDYTAISRDLYRTINYLHYVEPGTVGIAQLRDACFYPVQFSREFF